MSDWRLTPCCVGPLETNAYVLAAPAIAEAVLVDPGGDPQLLLAVLAKSSCRLRYLICTHGHFDHVAAAADIQRVWDTPLLCHPLDAPLIERMPDLQAGYGFPPSAIPRLASVLTDGQSLPFAGKALAISHVPGHSPGHVMLAWDNVALVGDTIFAGSVGRTDLPGSSFRDLEDSIQKRIFTLPSQTRLYPGHGPATTVAAEKAGNPFVRPIPE
jgi:hydroxyacylglutathione hydrolase